MAQVPANIHIGAAKIFLNVTAPASGTPPTLLAHTSGTPNAGSPVEVGYTNDAATFTYKRVKTEVTAEQSLNPVDVFIDHEECQVEFTAMEHVYTTLQAAFDLATGSGGVTDGSKDLFYAGDGASTTVNTQCVALTSVRRDASTKYIVACLYKVYNVEGIIMPYARTTPATYRIILKALTDTTRNAGDRLFQFYREK